jgi:hypothetical protein
MNPTLLRDVPTIFPSQSAPAQLKATAPLEVAARMLSSALEYEMSATTVVGVLGRDDPDAFRSLVSDLSDEYGLDATVKIQPGSYSVRFSRPPVPSFTERSSGGAS